MSEELTKTEVSNNLSDLETLKQKAEESQGFFITATFFDGRTLQHHMMTKNFPNVDLLSSLQKVRQMVINELDKPAPEKVVYEQDS